MTYPFHEDEVLPPPVAVEPVPGTDFSLALVGLARQVNGPAVTSLVTGIASLLVCLVVMCFGVLGAEDGWGPVVAGAFAVLALFLGTAAIVTGTVGRRHVRRFGHLINQTGAGLGLAGIILGGLGVGLTVLAMVLSLASA